MTTAGDEFRRLRDSLHEALVLCDEAIRLEDQIDDRALDARQAPLLAPQPGVPILDLLERQARRGRFYRVDDR